MVTLRCAVLNINGLRTKRCNKLDLPELTHVFQSNDIVLLTETWSGVYHDLHVDGFDCFILHRDENLLSCKRPSGGLAVYVRYKFVLNDTPYFQSQDDILCIKLAADKVNLQNDVYICLCYVIPENSSRQAFVTTHTYDRLLEFYTGLVIKYGDGLNFILSGDFNSRTSNLPDFVTDDNASNFGVLPEDYCADA